MLSPSEQFSSYSTHRSRRAFQPRNKFPKFNTFESFTQLWWHLRTTQANFEPFYAIFFNLIRNVTLSFFLILLSVVTAVDRKKILLYSTSM